MNSQQPNIVQTVKRLPFFQSFDDASMLQAAQFCEVQQYKKGDKILGEGVLNSNLYFLLSGKLMVSLAGEVVASLTREGDVFGEMSVITKQPAVTSIFASTDVECLVMPINKFSTDGVEGYRQQSILYQIFCRILVSRLIATNEKARLFEILNREMHEAQNKLSQRHANVLLVESDRKNQQPVKLALGGTGVKLDIADSAEKANELLSATKYDLLITEEKSAAALKSIGSIPSLLFTQCDVRGSVSVLNDNRCINHVLSRNADDRQGNIRNILTALSKILNTDYFGIEKYLAWGVDVKRSKVIHSAQREELKEEVFAYLKKMGIRTTILDRVNAVLEEMLMNAIYDAPVDAAGKSLFNHRSRKEVVQLDTHQQASLNFCCDGSNIAVSVVDTFGALTKDMIIDYLISCYGGTAGSLNEGKGGAGRGLHQIVEMADTTIFNVKKGVRTEVICLFNVDGRSQSIQPSIHYYFS